MMPVDLLVNQYTSLLLGLLCMERNYITIIIYVPKGDILLRSRGRYSLFIIILGGIIIVFLANKSITLCSFT